MSSLEHSDAVKTVQPCSLAPPLTIQGLMVALALSVILRLCYLVVVPYPGGDSFSYYQNAVAIGTGQPGDVDVFWQNLFCVWEAFVVWIGFSGLAALTLASLIPGVLLSIPAFVITRRFFGGYAAVFAALAVAVHPRFVEYSANGYSETFYMFCAAWGLWGLVGMWDDGKRGIFAACVAGLGLTAYCLVRNEGILLALILLAVASIRAVVRHSFLPVVVALLCSGGLFVAYSAVNRTILDDSGVGGKSSVLKTDFSLRRSSPHVDWHDWHILEAAEKEGRVKESMWDIILDLIWLYPRNLIYNTKDVAKLWLSVIPLFGLFSFYLLRIKGINQWDSLPIWLFTGYTLLLFPLLLTEPRYLFLSLFGGIVLGAGGLVGLVQILPLRFRKRRTMNLLTALNLAALLVLLPPLAQLKSRQLGYHQEVGTWIRENLPRDTPVLGDSLGYITATAFHAGTPYKFRRKLEDNPANLSKELSQSGCSALVIYEGYLRSANPELIPAFTNGFPGLTLIKEFAFPTVGRVHVYQLASS